MSNGSTAIDGLSGSSSGLSDAVVASSDGARPSPPALFAAGRFAELLALEGDHGARALIQSGVHIVTSPHELIDIDTAEDLAQLRALA